MEPRFLPEEVSPASGQHQTRMMQMFGDFEAWSMVIFDNILLLVHDKEDVCTKLRTFLQRCEKHNALLKVSKS